MTIRLAGLGIRAVLLDIEGTTTPIAFVHEVLFPFARARLRAFLAAEWRTPLMQNLVARLGAEHAAEIARGEAPPPLAGEPELRRREDATAFLVWLMDRDRKSPVLKELQGHIWEGGYQAGDLRGVVFDDVPPAIRRWRAANIDIAIYSSGSERAQRRLFESTAAGDLSPLLAGFFDTRVGAKGDPAAYARIAQALGRTPGEVLFVSDVTSELAAARAAGCETALALRPGNPPQPSTDGFQTVSTFDDLF